MDSSPSSSCRRPAFTVRSEFGGARRWRSRKTRPCDACRRRKTACIIETMPPCRFCESRGLPCESSLGPLVSKRRVSSARSATPEVVEAVEVSDMFDSENGSGEEEYAVSTGYSSQGNLSALDETSHTQPANQASSIHLHAITAATSASSPAYSSPVNDNLSPGTQASASISSSDSYMNPGSHTNASPGLAYQDGEKRTAHSIGLSGEQDTNLLASLRSIIVNERNAVDNGVIQVFSGDPVCGEPPIHFNMVLDDLPSRDLSTLAKVSNAVEEIVGPHGERLVSLYFKHVHPNNCLISERQFRSAYNANKLSLPASLRGAIYGLGAMMWNRELEPSESSTVDIYALFQQANYSLHTEYHAPNLWTLQAALLLLHERPGDNFTMETPRTWILSAQVVAIAQILGLHRDPKLWSLARWEKNMRRKLWWATYVSDVWTSIYHGNPPHISNDSFTTSPIEIEELMVQEEVEGELPHTPDVAPVSAMITERARFVEFVKLSRILRELLDSFYSDRAYKATLGDPATREKKLLNIENQLETWRLMSPSCVGRLSTDNVQDPSNNGPLRLAYFAIKALLFRALMWPVTLTSKHDPQSALRRFFDKAMTDFGDFSEFIGTLDSRMLHCFWGAHARSQLVLCGNFVVYLFLMAPSWDRVQLAFRLLESVYNAITRLRELAKTEDAIALLRPALLRMDTLFTQAATIMDTQVVSPAVAS